LNRNLRAKVAREAALLLYQGLEKEYKTAKEKAAETLGIRILPSNLEIAMELDELADELEGSERKEAVVRHRRTALKLMVLLEEFHPKLIGSVWRGTAYKKSDIDILTFTHGPQAVVDKLQESGFKNFRTEWRKKLKNNRVKNFFHIYLSLPEGYEAEIIVRRQEDLNLKEKCDIYSDVISGLTAIQLKEVLDKDPLMKFLPKGK